MSKQNFPNQLTVLRGLLTLAIIFLFFVPTTYQYPVILILFVIACLTDFLDGYLARRWQVVSDFGKVFDPLFDKILTFSLYFLLIPYFGSYLSIVFILLVIRDVTTDGMKGYLLSKNIVTPAIVSAKMKTTSQMITIVFALLFLIYALPWLLTCTYVVGAIAVLLSYYSGSIYTKKFLKHFN